MSCHNICHTSNILAFVTEVDGTLVAQSIGSIPGTTAYACMQYLCDVEPASQTVAQHHTNIGSTSYVFWAWFMSVNKCAQAQLENT